MAVSAFKSSSKRGNLSNSASILRPKSNFENEIFEKSTKKDVTQRRSRSVSAFSRSNSDVVSEFLNKRDNPLFCNGTSSGMTAPPDDMESKSGKGVKASKDEGTRAGYSGSVESSRGRSVARNAGDGMKSAGNRKEIGRSLSRVDTGRRGRSVSVRPAYRHHSESEAEQECSSSLNCLKSYDSNIGINDGNYVHMARNSFDLSDGMESPRTWRSQHPAPIEISNTSVIPSWEVEGLMSSVWDAEEKSSNTVCHQMKEDLVHVEDDISTGEIYETVRLEVRRAISDIQHDLETAIRRNNKIFPTSNNGVDAPADSVTSGPVELVVDIRKEYAKELEKSQERARKLRADLALEEHHGLEINRIMKELLPDQKTPSSLHRSRPAKKSSIERRKMSRSLAEEAMIYFDECVSISTFDSSDFSSQEDPPVKLFGTTSLVVGNTSILPRSSSASTTDSPRSCLTYKEIGFEGQQMHVLDGSGLTASSSSNCRTYDHTSPYGTKIEQSWPFQFSFAGKPSENFGLQRDINSYIKNFEKGIEKDRIDSKIAKSKSNHCDLDEYNMHVPSQSFLLDKVMYKNRIESGSLHICGSPFSVSSYASFL